MVPGDRRRGLLVPSEQPPGHVLAGNSINEPAEIEQAGLPLPQPQASYTPIDRYHRVEWVCEAARDAVWYTSCGGFVVHRVPGADVGAGKYVTV